METGPGTLHVRLLDKRSSIPLGAARVTCVWRNQKMSLMEADGRGSYTGELPEGVYDLLVAAQGYFSLLLRGIGVLAGYDQQITRGLIPGDAHDREPEGLPSTAIGGYVTDRLDHAVQGVVVHVQGAASTTTVRAFGESHGHSSSAHTTATGAYVIHGVPPGAYELQFRVHERTVHSMPLSITDAKAFVRADVRLANLSF